MKTTARTTTEGRKLNFITIIPLYTIGEQQFKNFEEAVEWVRMVPEEGEGRFERVHIIVNFSDIEIEGHAETREAGVDFLHVQKLLLRPIPIVDVKK